MRKPMYRETIAVVCNNHGESTLCGNNAEVLMLRLRYILCEPEGLKNLKVNVVILNKWLIPCIC